MEPVDSPTISPSYLSMLASEQTIETLMQPAYWASVCPHLHVSSSNFMESPLNVFDFPEEAIQKLKKEIIEDGYFHVEALDLPWTVNVASLAAGVLLLKQNGWSPNFITVYDEAWLIPHQISKLIKAVTGNEMIMDWYTWHVDPLKRARGWAPHRDRPESDPFTSFHKDHTPMYNTVWIPFTDADPNNSCLYIVPAGADPGYGGNRDDLAEPVLALALDLDGAEISYPNPLEAIFTTPEAYQEIRALPATAGSMICFSHRLIHWGSRANPRAKHARFAFSFASADDSFEQPYFSRDHLPFPSLPLRTALVASQAITYAHQEPLSQANEALFYRIFMTQHKDFNTDYCEKITSAAQWLKFTRKQTGVQTKSKPK